MADYKIICHVQLGYIRKLPTRCGGGGSSPIILVNFYSNTLILFDMPNAKAVCVLL